MPATDSRIHKVCIHGTGVPTPCPGAVPGLPRLHACSKGLH
ncbi:MAG: hypothetical protein Q8N17_21245 [Burkholderiaceae bacterium]|nr:hypothetical protein [Burkholderiaceae bacterium]